MRNRRKTLLRDHSVLEVTLKACPRQYSVSAVPETLTFRGPKRPSTSPSSSTSSGKGQNSDSILLISWSTIRVSSLHNSFASLLIHWIHTGDIGFSISVRSENLYGLLNSIIPCCLQSRSSVAKL